MKRLVIIVAVAAVLAPTAALASSTDPAQNASRDCTVLKAKMGTFFASAFPTFGACVSSMTPVEQSNVSSAQSACTAAQTADAAAFAAKWGNGKNAFGKCVSAGAQASSQAEQQGRPNPAQTCRSQRTGMTVSAFDKLYGTNGNAKNAFGKCVSKAARAQISNELNASSSCRTEQNADANAFASKYGTNADKSNAFGQCVSSKAQAASQAQQQATVSAAKACLAELNAGAAAFKTKYGTFGGCVSLKASGK